MMERISTKELYFNMLSNLILFHSVSDQSILFHEKRWIIFYQVHYLAQAILDSVKVSFYI